MNVPEKYMEVYNKIKEIKERSGAIRQEENLWRENFYEITAAHIKDIGLLKKYSWSFCKWGKGSTLVCNHKQPLKDFVIVDEYLPGFLPEEIDIAYILKTFEVGWSDQRPLMWTDEAEWIRDQNPAWIKTYLQREDRPERKAVVHFRYNDDEMRIIADSHKYMLRFINEFDLTIDLSDLYEQKDKLEKELKIVNDAITTQKEDFPKNCDVRKLEHERIKDLIAKSKAAKEDLS